MIATRPASGESWQKGLFGIATRATGAFCQLVITVLVGRSAGAAAVALYIAMSTWFRVAEVALGLGISPQLLRDGARLEKRESASILLQSGVRAVRITILGSVAVGMTAAAVASAIGESRAALVIVFATLGGAATARLKLTVDVLKARGRARSALAFEFSFAPLMTMSIVGALTIGGVEATGVTWIGAYASGAALGMLCAQALLLGTERRRRQAHVREYSARSAESRRFLTTGVLAIGLWALPILTLPLLVSGEDAGRFALSFRLVAVADLILAGLTAVFAPAFSRAWAAGDLDDLRAHYRRSRWVATATFVPFVALIAVFGRTVLGTFGEEFPSAYPVLLIAGCGHLVNAVTGLVSELLLMTRAEHQELRVSAAALSLMAVLLVPAALAFGIIGAAVVYSASLVTRNGLAWLAVRRRLRADVIGPVTGSGRVVLPDVNIDAAPTAN